MKTFVEDERDHLIEVTWGYARVAVVLRPKTAGPGRRCGRQGAGRKDGMCLEKVIMGTMRRSNTQDDLQKTQERSWGSVLLGVSVSKGRAHYLAPHEQVCLV